VREYQRLRDQYQKEVAALEAKATEQSDVQRSTMYRTMVEARMRRISHFEDQIAFYRSQIKDIREILRTVLDKYKGQLNPTPLVGGGACLSAPKTNKINPEDEFDNLAIEDTIAAARAEQAALQEEIDRMMEDADRDREKLEKLARALYAETDEPDIDLAFFCDDTEPSNTK
jgi:endonuclease III